jgi:hypothetical protein
MHHRLTFSSFINLIAETKTIAPSDVFKLMTLKNGGEKEI